MSYADGVFGGFTIANGAVIENARSGAGDDKLIGNDAANTLTANAGSDLLRGGGGIDWLLGGLGDDWIEGGAGADTMTGGTGKDVFAFARDLAAGKDRITDFGADDFIVTTVAFRDGNKDGLITFNKNKAFDFTQGGSVAVSGANDKAVGTLHHDGSHTEDGVEYFIYSLVGGNGEADFASQAAGYDFA